MSKNEKNQNFKNLVDARKMTILGRGSAPYLPSYRRDLRSFSIYSPKFMMSLLICGGPSLLHPEVIKSLKFMDGKFLRGPNIKSESLDLWDYRVWNSCHFWLLQNWTLVDLTFWDSRSTLRSGTSPKIRFGSWVFGQSRGWIFWEGQNFTKSVSRHSRRKFGEVFGKESKHKNLDFGLSSMAQIPCTQTGWHKQDLKNIAPGF